MLLWFDLLSRGTLAVTPMYQLCALDRDWKGASSLYLSSSYIQSLGYGRVLDGHSWSHWKIQGGLLGRAVGWARHGRQRRAIVRADSPYSRSASRITLRSPR